MDIEQAQMKELMKETWFIADLLRMAAKRYGLYHVRNFKFLFWHYRGYRQMFFDQIIITPENIQYQLMRFTYTQPKRMTKLNFRPTGYKGWLDRSPLDFDYGSIPDGRYHDLYAAGLLWEMSSAVQRHVTTPNPSAEAQGIWYVVEKLH